MKLFINITLLSTTILLLIFNSARPLNIVVRSLLIVLPQLILICSMIFKWKKWNTIAKLFQTIFVVGCISIIMYIILNKLNVFEKLSSVAEFKKYINSLGAFGIVMYILIQILQVVFLPIPASIICIVGSLIYGPLIGGLYCCIGVVIGSVLSYIIGRVFGYRLVAWIIGEDKTNKYAGILRKRGGIFLALAFLLPMFPDDILCFIAGVTKMATKTFILISLITRPIGVICMAIFGSGYIIPFSGWGIYAWIGILILALILMLVVYKYQDKMQEYVISRVFNKSKKSLNHKNS